MERKILTENFSLPPSLVHSKPYDRKQNTEENRKVFHPSPATAFTNKLHQLELNSIEKYINVIAPNIFALFPRDKEKLII